MIAHSDPHSPRVVLIGPPGAGKTTIGRKLARELGVELYDTDAGIEEITGRTIPEIFATDGEPEFRRIEEEVVSRALRSQQGVVSLGGGAILSAHTRALLRDRTVVYLEISVAEGLRRTGAVNTRPLLGGADPGAKYRELMRIRRPLYREVSTVRVRTDGRSPGRVVRAILGKLSLESVLDTVEPETPAPAAPQRAGRSRARRRARARARRAADAHDTTAAPPDGPASHGSAEKTDASGEAGNKRDPRAGGADGAPPPESTAETDLRTPGRSRRARARRARARRQQREQAEQTKTGTEQSR